MMKYIKPALAALPAAITAACLLTGCAGTDSPAGSPGEGGDLIKREGGRCVEEVVPQGGRGRVW